MSSMMTTSRPAPGSVRPGRTESKFRLGCVARLHAPLATPMNGAASAAMRFLPTTRNAPIRRRPRAGSCARCVGTRRAQRGWSVPLIAMTSMPDDGTVQRPVARDSAGRLTCGRDEPSPPKFRLGCVTRFQLQLALSLHLALHERAEAREPRSCGRVSRNTRRGRRHGAMHVRPRAGVVSRGFRNVTAFRFEGLAALIL
jgi:hypothetical protein